MINIDSLFRVWQRISLPDECEPDLRKFIKNEGGKVTDAKIYEWALVWAEENGIELEKEILEDTAVPIRPKQNKGRMTIEIEKESDDGSKADLIYRNGK